jgi:acyl carrier protein
MSTGFIKSTLKKIFRKRFLINYVYLSNNLHLKEIGLNAMEKLEMVYYLESEFNITLSDQEVIALRTVGDTIRCVERNLMLQSAVA